MRVLMLEPGPGYSVYDVHAGWQEAFRQLGCTVASLNLAERLDFYASAGKLTVDGQFMRMVPNDTDVVRMAAKGILAACMEFRPHVVFITSCFFIPKDTLDVMRAAGIKVVINHLESPYEDGKQAKRAEFADLNLINDPTNLACFPKGTVYMPAAYRPSLHRPGPTAPEFAPDFSFVGTGYPSRIEFLEQVDWDGIDVALAGNWMRLDDDHPLAEYVVHDRAECFNNEDTVALYRSSTTSANLYRKEADHPELSAGWAVGPREIELAAIGCWFARNARPESDDLFPMLPTFDTPEELGDIIRWALSHPQERQDAAHAARASIAERTFENNARRLLQLVAA